MFTTDLELSVTQIIEYYGARWKIESGFKELKQDIGSRTSQCRNAQAVNNHLQFCMMASTITWLYADHVKANPEHRHKFNIHAQRTWNCINPLEGGQAVLHRRQA